MHLSDYPKFSIITPSFNQGSFLEKTILSIIDQKYPNLEFFIIDGGSTDNSVEVIKKYEDRITWWISEKDKGTFDANNKGLEKITGDFWCVVNSDDVLLPGALHTVAEVIKNNPTQKWFAGGVKYIDELGNPFGEDMPKPPKPVHQYTFLTGCWISHPTVFLHKSFINEIGNFHKYHLLDMNYWLRLEKAGYFPYIINSYLSGLRIHQNCKSSDRIKLFDEFLRVVTDFTTANELAGISEVRTALKKSKEYGNRLNLSKSLVEGGKLKSVSLLLTILINRPFSVFSIWFRGALKRIIFGMAEDDPLFKQFPSETNSANWSN